MIGLPLLGWATASTTRSPSAFQYFGTASIPPLPLPADRTLHAVFEFGHSKGAWLLLVLLALHAAAAIKHHVIDRDDVLTRMVPFLKR